MKWGQRGKMIIISIAENIFKILLSIFHLFLLNLFYYGVERDYQYSSWPDQLEWVNYDNPVTGIIWLMFKWPDSLRPLVSASWWRWCLDHDDGDGVWIIFPEFSGRQWAPSWRRGLRNTSVHSNGIEERDKQCTFLNQEGGGGMTIQQNRTYTIKLFLIINYLDQ